MPRGATWKPGAAWILALVLNALVVGHSCSADLAGDNVSCTVLDHELTVSVDRVELIQSMHDRRSCRSRRPSTSDNRPFVGNGVQNDGIEAEYAPKPHKL